jgi:GntR family transcriptional regulator
VIVRVDDSSPVPPFEQLRAQIAALIEGGELEQGHQLPPIRQLANDLGVAPGTVARAYRELEAAGLVESNGRRGTRVAASLAYAATKRRLLEGARAFAVLAQDLEVETEDALAAVRAALMLRP